MKKLRILIPRHFNFDSSHFINIWLDSVLPELSKIFFVEIVWFYYSPTKLKNLPIDINGDVIQIQDFHNAFEVVEKIKPDLILDSEFPSLIDLSFLAAAKNNSFYVRKYQNHTIFKVPLKLRQTIIRMSKKIPSNDSTKQSTRNTNFFFYKYYFFLKSLIASNLTLLEKLNFFYVSLKWNFVTEHPIMNPKIQTDLELLNSNFLQETLLEKKFDISRMKVVGNPIYDDIFQKRNKSKSYSNQKLKILFAPFQQYGDDHQDFQERIIKDIITKIISKKDKLSLTVKLHPSNHNFNYFKKLISSLDDSIEIFQKGSIQKHVEESDIVVSYGLVTSASIYGLILKKPMIFCDFYNQYSYKEFKNIILECKNPNDFLNIVTNSHKINQRNFKTIENFLEKNYFKTDGLCSYRIAEAIKSLLEQRN